MPNPYKPIERAKEGDDLSAAAYNRLVDQVNRNRVIPGDGLAHSFTEAGCSFSVLPQERLFGALTPSTGIPPATGSPPVPGSASCTIYELGDGSVAWSALGGSYAVYNHFTSTSSTGIGGSKFIIVYLNTSGVFIALLEPC